MLQTLPPVAGSMPLAPLQAFADFPIHALMPFTQRPQLVFTEGRGSWLQDSQGRRYLDLVQGWAVNTLGHAPPEIAAALADQAGRLLHVGPGLHNAPAIALAERLTALSGLGRCFLAGSGAEANEGAIKLARKFGRKKRGGAHEIITFRNAFHGRTLATMSASGKPGFDTMFAPQVPGFPKATLNDIGSVTALIGPGTVAVMLEPIQGEAGVVEATPDFLRALRRLCNELGLLLIVDEVQTGIGRTGTLFAHQRAGITPDVMTLGKGLGGGVPIAALLAKDEVCCFEPGDQGGTYTGNPLVCAAALAVLQVVTATGFIDAMNERATQFRDGLDALALREGGPPCSGQGLLLALELPQPGRAQRLADALRERPGQGLLLNAVRPERLRLMPALNATTAELALALAWLDEALHATA
ncbi:aminotransferase class III-fold pyridoxal phosphate-dependent enzyme [Ideonella sp.]|uniref:aminotransferase class III-fold pyridoxal phosphate-dependent enzyme n=1 Tax=Ideonella sp. TaxID=1929293 RepID=UPI0035B3824B